MVIFQFAVSMFTGKAEEFQTLKEEKEQMRQRGALRTQRTAKDLADLLIGALAGAGMGSDGFIPMGYSYH